jgi:hypothetical protein
VSVDRFRFQIEQSVGASLLFDAGRLLASDGHSRCRDCLRLRHLPLQPRHAVRDHPLNDQRFAGNGARWLILSEPMLRRLVRARAGVA